MIFIVENMKIPAHKAILSTRSAYIRTLFGENFAEAKQSEVKLEVSLNAFKLILRFIYTGCLTLSSLNVKQVIELYHLVELYDFELLKETFHKYLKANLLVDNCIEILNAAYIHSQKDLQAECLAFMDRHSTEILKHDTFKSISSTLLCTLLERARYIFCARN